MEVFENSNVSATSAAATTKVTTKKLTTSKNFLSTSTRTSSITTESAIDTLQSTIKNDINNNNNNKKKIISTKVVTSTAESINSTINTNNYNNNNNLEYDDDDDTHNKIVNGKEKLTDSMGAVTNVKKKTKKTKKSIDGKENISVKKIYLMDQPPNNWRPYKENSNRIVTINRSVSVKNLCRSFGDLTIINNSDNHKSGGFNSENKTNLKRAKSVGELTKQLPVQIYGVSVRALRDSYCNLVGLLNRSSCNVTNFYCFKKKSSFSKFDALQKKNILNIRSSDSNKAQEKFSESITDREPNCRSCGKIVYKMEEIKAERNIWHKNCFKCKECNKQLNVDTFESHESELYCKPHFKLLFAPKAVENNEPVKPKKPELIIRENQPIELPPDVVRASNKPDLGLEEIQQLNVKSRFQMFENYQEQQQQLQDQKDTMERGNGVKRSATILSKLAKFNAKGMNTGVTDDDLNGIQYDDSHSDNNYSDDDDDDDDIEKKLNDINYDPDLIRAKRAQRERPMHFDQMNDIKTKFEKGHIQSREERREERKQEIQNIRSRLFMGKQARIKEQYQQAVADSEQGITSVGKKPDIDIGDKAKSIKEKFEKGEIFRDYNDDSSRVQDDEMAVFESGIGKQSRSLFMELDANATKSPQFSSNPTTPKTPDSRKQVSPLQEELLKPFTGENVIKCDEKQDDIKIETSEISSKFKFFETYKPKENQKKLFRITPPRDGVVKMPSPEHNIINNDINNDDPFVAEQQQTATKMLSKFRELEQRKNRWQNNDENDIGLKPLKCFTPPPDDNRRVYDNDDDDDGEEEDDDDEYDDDDVDEENDDDIDNNKYHSARYDDEFLKAAQSAARAKQLRAKFEKWEANEIKREMHNGQIDVYDNLDESQTESAKSLKAKFESMKDQTHSSPRPRVQVNRFVLTFILSIMIFDVISRPEPPSSPSSQTYQYNQPTNSYTPSSSSSSQQGTIYGPPTQAPIIHKHVYVHVPPPEPEYQPPRKTIQLPPPQKHYKIVFIKAPSGPVPTVPVIPPLPQNEEKTLVYVLVKKPDEQPDLVIPTAQPTQPSKPEVYFIRYKTQKQDNGGPYPNSISPVVPSGDYGAPPSSSILPNTEYGAPH